MNLALHGSSSDVFLEMELEAAQACSCHPEDSSDDEEDDELTLGSSRVHDSGDRMELTLC